jgi:hypothetical protein
MAARQPPASVIRLAISGRRGHPSPGCALHLLRDGVQRRTAPCESHQCRGCGRASLLRPAGSRACGRTPGPEDSDQPPTGLRDRHRSPPPAGHRQLRCRDRRPLPRLHMEAGHRLRVFNAGLADHYRPHPPIVGLRRPRCRVRVTPRLGLSALRARPIHHRSLTGRHPGPPLEPTASPHCRCASIASTT